MNMDHLIDNRIQMALNIYSKYQRMINIIDMATGKDNVAMSLLAVGIAKENDYIDTNLVSRNSSNSRYQGNQPITDIIWSIEESLNKVIHITYMDIRYSVVVKPLESTRVLYFYREPTIPGVAAYRNNIYNFGVTVTGNTVVVANFNEVVDGGYILDQRKVKEMLDLVQEQFDVPVELIKGLDIQGTQKILDMTKSHPDLLRELVEDITWETDDNNRTKVTVTLEARCNIYQVEINSRRYGFVDGQLNWYRLEGDTRHSTGASTQLKHLFQNVLIKVVECELPEDTPE